MKRAILFILVSLAFAACKNMENGELTGVLDRPQWEDYDPYGTKFIEPGSYRMGVSDEDIDGGYTATPKTVSIRGFYMDETEITNNEYRQFVFWVRDSIARRMLIDAGLDQYAVMDENGEMADIPALDWTVPIEWEGEEESEALEGLFYREEERFYHKKEIDTRKLNFAYSWIDLRGAAQKDVSTANTYKMAGVDDMGSFKNRKKSIDRSTFIKRKVINVYPDTLCWMHEYTYSYNEDLTESYFSHPSYDNYPVVGVSWQQAQAFCVWRTNLLKGYMTQQEMGNINKWRLPMESEWEWAARGGSADLSKYPWGGPYARTSRGCFLANFKPERGDYQGDGGNTTVIVGHYAPNDWGLYDMAGNVSEWCEDAYDQSAYNFSHDMNPTYIYNAKDDDSPTLKRKVIRGGSWKDTHYYIQVSARDHEYQDTGKCYLGFRCVSSYLGRNRFDNPKTASNVYRN